MCCDWLVSFINGCGTPHLKIHKTGWLRKVNIAPPQMGQQQQCCYVCSHHGVCVQKLCSAPIVVVVEGRALVQCRISGSAVQDSDPPPLSSRIFSFLDVVTLCRCAQVSRVSLCSLDLYENY